MLQRAGRGVKALRPREAAPTWWDRRTQQKLAGDIKDEEKGHMNKSWIQVTQGCIWEICCKEILFILPQAFLSQPMSRIFHGQNYKIATIPTI